MSKAAILAPSMMVVPIEKTLDYLRLFEKNNIGYLHIDVMDGHFVDNLMLGTAYVRQLRKLSCIPLDIHLMIERPEHKIEWFDVQQGEIVSVSVESTAHVQKCLAQVRSLGGKAFVAINPGTGLDCLEYLWPDLDGVLVMTVNPGFAGQKVVPEAMNKVMHIKERAKQRGKNDLIVAVDGNVSWENAPKMRKLGADMFIVGTSSVFTAGAAEAEIEKNIARLRRLLEN